jgi:hypothetical protein
MTDAEKAVATSAMRYWKQVEDLRVKRSQKLYFWYHNYQDEILKYISQAMLKGWREKTISETRIRVLNVVARVIDKLALVYKERPERVLDGGKQFEVKVAEMPAKTPDATPPSPSSVPPVPPSPKLEQKEIQSEDDKVFQELLKNSTIEKKQSEWEKLSKLFNTVLVQPIWREDDGKDAGGSIDFLIHTPAWCCVETKDEDYTQPNSFWYPIWKSTGEGKAQEQVLIYWDETEHYIIDANGNRINGKDNSEGKNPYSLLPVAVLRRKLSIDFWGEGMWDLVDGNEEICIQISNLFKVAAFQLHGQPFGVNLGLDGEPALGADKPILVSGVEQGMVQPTFEFVTASPLLKPVMDLVDWALKNIQIAKGIGANQVEVLQSVASGASKMVDNADVQEERSDVIPILQEFEKDLYRRTIAVYNYHASGTKIKDTAEFSVKFPEPKITETQDEKNKKREAGLKNGTMSRVDIIMEDNNLSREEAKLKLRQIIAENKEFKDEFGLNSGAMDNVPDEVGGFVPKTPEEIALMSPEEKKAYDAEVLANKLKQSQPQPPSAVTKNLKR